jgi:hypothetical protein
LPRVAKEKTNMNDRKKILLERRRRGLAAYKLAAAGRPVKGAATGRNDR